MHREPLLRIPNGHLSRKPRTRQRGRTYRAKVADAVTVIARRCECLRCRRSSPEGPRGHGGLVLPPRTQRESRKPRRF